MLLRVVAATSAFSLAIELMIFYGYIWALLMGHRPTTGPAATTRPSDHVPSLEASSGAPSLVVTKPGTIHMFLAASHVPEYHVQSGKDLK